MDDKTKTNGSGKIKVGFEIDDQLWADFNIYLEEKHYPTGCCKCPGDMIRKLIKSVLLGNGMEGLLGKYGPEL